MTWMHVLCRDCGEGFSTNSVQVGPGNSIEFRDCTFGPCPKCGGLAEIPSGSYTEADGHIFFRPRSIVDKMILERALHTARKAARGEIGIARAKEIAPELSVLWDLVPENRTQAYQFWALVIAAIGACLLAYQTFGTKPPQIVVPRAIIDAIQAGRPPAPENH